MCFFRRQLQNRDPVILHKWLVAREHVHEKQWKLKNVQYVQRFSLILQIYNLAQFFFTQISFLKSCVWFHILLFSQLILFIYHLLWLLRELHTFALPYFVSHSCGWRHQQAIRHNHTLLSLTYFCLLISDNCVCSLVRLLKPSKLNKKCILPNSDLSFNLVLVFPKRPAFL